MEKFQDLLIEKFHSQAEYFLKEAGAFYPFGSVLENNGNVKPVSAYWEGDFPGSREIIDILKNYFFERLKNEDLLIEGICIEVKIFPDNVAGIQIEMFANSLKENRTLMYVTDRLDDEYSFKLVHAWISDLIKIFKPMDQKCS